MKLIAINQYQVHVTLWQWEGHRVKGQGQQAMAIEILWTSEAELTQTLPTVEPRTYVFKVMSSKVKVTDNIFTAFLGCSPSTAIYNSYR